jgi:hypothetical protein
VIVFHTHGFDSRYLKYKTLLGQAEDYGYHSSELRHGTKEEWLEI